MHAMTDSLKFTDETPDGFSLSHDEVSPEVWANIRRWLSSDMLPSTEESNEKVGAAATMPPSAVASGENCLTCVPIPWETGPQMQGRRIAQFGNCGYDYAADVAERRDPSMNDVPDYIRRTLLSGEPNFRQYTQCIINAYEAGDVIPWHVDHEYFGPEVLVYTFGEDRPLLMRKPLNDDDKSIEDDGNPISMQKTKEGRRSDDEGDKFHVHTRAFPRHCSKYLLSGPARRVWEHSVPSGKGERVSITFRSWVGPKQGD